MIKINDKGRGKAEALWLDVTQVQVGMEATHAQTASLRPGEDAAPYIQNERLELSGKLG